MLGPDIAALDALGQRHFLLRGEQFDPPDLLEVHAHRVGGGHVHGEVQLIRPAARPLPLLPAGVELELLVGVDHRLVDHLDALVEQGGVHELNLLGGEVDL